MQGFGIGDEELEEGLGRGVVGVGGEGQEVRT